MSNASRRPTPPPPPVLVLTADERRESADLAEALGARRCLHKGSTLFDQLSRYLRELDGPPPER